MPPLTSCGSSSNAIRDASVPGSRRLPVRCKARSEKPYRFDLFRSAVGPLVTVASIHTTKGAAMRSKTNTTKKQTASVRSRGDSVNQVTLIGRLVAAPELRETASGKHVTTARVATNGKTHAEFHAVVLWGQLADLACQYPAKGRLVYIEGRLQSRQRQPTTAAFDGPLRSSQTSSRHSPPRALRWRRRRSVGARPRGSSRPALSGI